MLQKEEETPLIPCSAEGCLSTWGETPALILPERSLQGRKQGGRSFSAVIPLGPKGRGAHMGRKRRGRGTCCHPVGAGTAALIPHTQLLVKSTREKVVTLLFNMPSSF